MLFRSEILADPEVSNSDRKEAQLRVSFYNTALALHDRITDLTKSLSEAEEALAAESDAEMKEMFTEEISDFKSQKETAEKELYDISYTTDEHDDRSVFIELRAGAGGQEAALFVANLYEAYQLYAATQGWRVSIASFNQTDIGGYKELVISIKGTGVYKKLKFESGVHRVQRVPATETQGRVHTSTITVAVMPEAEEVDVDINPNDLRIDTYRAGGAGGQHVNKTDSAVRITHIPTGVVVQCQDERSQLKNKNKAMKELASRLLEAEKQRQRDAEASDRKQQIGSGDRSEKIRTYNYPQNRVTDHRIGLTLKKLEYIMQGSMNEVVDPLVEYDLAHNSKVHPLLTKTTALGE